MIYKAILFDYGGTLDTNGRHWADVIWEAYIKNNIQIDYNLFFEAYVYAEQKLERNRIILSTDSFFITLQKKMNLQQEFLQSKNIYIKKEILSGIVQYCHNIVINNINYTRSIIEPLSKITKLAIISNFYGNLETVLLDYDLNYFSLILDSTNIGIRKPNISIFQYALNELKISPNECLVVGDSLKNDIYPAIKLNCSYLWLNPDSNTDITKDLLIIRELKDIFNYL